MSITITRRDEQHLSLKSDYRHKDAIKAIAPYPAVRWDGDARCWLVDARMIDSVIHHLGAELASLPVDLVMSLPVVQATQPKRRTPRREKPSRSAARAAHTVGVILHADNPFEAKP